MADRPVFHKQIGAFFVGLRSDKKWTQRQAEIFAGQRGLGNLTRQVLWRLEKGKIKNVEPDVLKDVAALYGLSYEEIAARYLKTRYGVDLLRPPPEYQSTLPEGSADVSAPAAQARILDELERLRRENSELEATLSDVRDLTRKLFTLAVRGAEDGETAPTEAEGRKDGRRTGR